MKILSTLILLAVTTSAFADSEISNPKPFSIVPEGVAVNLEVRYEAMIDKAETTLKALDSIYSYEEVKAVSTAVIDKENLCDKDTHNRQFVEILECKKNIADLTEQLTQDVMKKHK